MSKSLQDLDPRMLRTFLRWLGGDKAIELEVGAWSAIYNAPTQVQAIKVADRFDFAIVDRDIHGAARGGFRRISNAYQRVHAIMVANTMGLGPAELAIVYNGIADYFATEASRIEATLTASDMERVGAPTSASDPLGMVEKATHR